jgi:polysaccharide biosynthesis transport protein
METRHSSPSEPSPNLPQGPESTPPSPAPLLVESQEDLWDLSWVFNVLRRKALLILQITVSITTLAAGAVMLSSSLTKPLYQGSFELQVEPATTEAKFSRSFLRAQSTDRVLEDAQTGNIEDASTLDYETQIRILRSRNLLEPVLEKVKSRYPGLTYEYLSQALTVERIKFTKDGKEQGTRLLDVTYKASDRDEVLLVLQTVSEAYLKYSVTERQTSMRQGIKFIDEQLPQLQLRVNTLQSQIEALRQQNTLMDPEKEGEGFSQLLASLRSKQVEATAKLQEAQSRHQTLQEQLASDNALAVLGEFSSFQELLGEYQKLEAQLANTSARLDEDSPPMQALRSKRQNLQVVLNQEAERLLSRSAAQIEIAQSQQQVLTEAENRFNDQFQRLPAVARQYATLKQELQIATETLNRFLSKNETLSIDAAQQEVPWQLTAAPSLTHDLSGQPANLSSKNNRLLVAIAAILAALLAVGLAFLIELLQDILYTPNEVRRMSRFPLFGTVPLMDSSSSLGLFPMSLPTSLVESSGLGAPSARSWTDPKHWTNHVDQLVRKVAPFGAQDAASKQSQMEAFTETFNLIHAKIDFSNPRSPIRSLAVGSANPQEGKSTIATSLANAAAIAGKKVLLVDANLRFPQLHTCLQYELLDNFKGLSDLIDSPLDLHQVIQPSLLEPNLFVLTAGQTRSNPVRLLSSQRLKDLMQKFTAEFDLVIYDTPSLLSFADASLIGAQVDGFIVIASLGKTTRSVLSQTLERLKSSRVPILGLVANGSKNTEKEISTACDSYSPAIS